MQDDDALAERGAMAICWNGRAGDRAATGRFREDVARQTGRAVEVGVVGVRLERKHRAHPCGDASAVGEHMIFHAWTVGDRHL